MKTDNIKINPLKNMLVVLPQMYDNTLKLLDLINKEGDGFLLIKNQDENQPITIQCISDVLCSSGLNLLTMARSLKEFEQKVNPRAMKDLNDLPYVLYNLNAMTGLPGIKPVEELKELKDLLIFLKDSALENLENRLVLNLHRGFGPTALEIEAGNNDLLKKELNEKMNEKINLSPVLSQWLASQKKAIESKHTQVTTLWATLDTFDLFNKQEKEIWLNAQKSDNDLIKTKHKF